MERPSGKFNRLAKPAFDRDNPNAVLGEVAVPGLQEVQSPVSTLVCCISELAHCQLDLTLVTIARLGA